jgi:8-oxo-dGTP diphosphatase
MNLEFAQKILASGCIFRDHSGRILLVKPTYKPGWEIPGGMVEANESPVQACLREAREEIGLEVNLGRLLCVDYVGVEIAPLERLMFVFDAGIISDLEIARIVLPPDELSEFCLVTLSESQELLPERLALRVRQSLIALEHPVKTVYLEEWSRRLTRLSFSRWSQTPSQTLARGRVCESCRAQFGNGNLGRYTAMLRGSSRAGARCCPRHRGLSSSKSQPCHNRRFPNFRACFAGC